MLKKQWLGVLQIILWTPGSVVLWVLMGKVTHKEKKLRKEPKGR